MAETNLAKNKNGYGYKYTDLAQIHEYLESNKLSYIQEIRRIGEDDYIYTLPLKENKPMYEYNGGWLQGAKVADAVLQGIKNPAQEQGSAITYARRYSLLMAFGLATEDDDCKNFVKDNNVERKASKKQVDLLEQKLTQEEKTKTLEYYKINSLKDLSSENASKLIQKIMNN